MVALVVCSLPAGGGALALPPQAAAEPFRWEGRLARDRTVEIKGVTGDIHVTEAKGDRVEVTARRLGRRDDPMAVRIEVVEHAEGVTICAVYPSSDGRNECRPGVEGRMHVNRNDVEVDFEVRVPAGIAFIGRTVNGGVDIDEVSGNVEAYSVNGSVRIGSRGFVQAETVNGSIAAVFGRTDWSDTREFRTVNGSITLDLPDGLSTSFRAETVNGSIDSDFPVTVNGRVSSRRLQGVIGENAGSRELLLSTVNGDIRLRRVRR
jgi:hypothetical protein